MAADPTVLPEKSIWSAVDPRTPVLAKEGAPMAFSVDTVLSDQGPRPLLFAAYMFPETFANRFRPAMPAPIFVTAVNRRTGVVYMRELSRDDSPPVTVNTAGSAPKSPWRVQGAVVEGPDVRIGGFVTVNLVRHLGLPRVAGVYDVYLWVDAFVTDMQTVTIDGEPGAAPEPALHRRPDTIASVRAAPMASNQVTLLGTGSDRTIAGGSPIGPVTIVALSTIQRRIGWIRIAAPGPGGLEFAVRVEELVGPTGPDERVVAFAFANGVRSRMLDTAAAAR